MVASVAVLWAASVSAASPPPSGFEPLTATPPAVPPAPTAPPPRAPVQSVSCTHELGYTYVYELEDWDHLDDVPGPTGATDTAKASDAARIAAGFSNANAYYIGNAALKAAEMRQAEICLGYRATACKSACGSSTACSSPGSTCDAYMGCVRRCGCVFDCHTVDESYVHTGLTSPDSSSLAGGEAWPVFRDFDSSQQLKRMLACMTGQCRATSAGDTLTIGGFITHPSGEFVSRLGTHSPAPQSVVGSTDICRPSCVLAAEWHHIPLTTEHLGGQLLGHERLVVGRVRQ
jgi:hypothetical protein